MLQEPKTPKLGKRPRVDLAMKMLVKKACNRYHRNKVNRELTQQLFKQLNQMPN